MIVRRESNLQHIRRIVVMMIMNIFIMCALSVIFTEHS